MLVKQATETVDRDTETGLTTAQLLVSRKRREWEKLSAAEHAAIDPRPQKKHFE